MLSDAKAIQSLYFREIEGNAEALRTAQTAVVLN